MSAPLSILMITHHRSDRARGRSLSIGKYLAQRGHRVTACVTANTRKVGITSFFQDGLNVVEFPDLLWGKLRSGWDGWNLLNRELYLRKNRDHFDLIHCFETRPNTIFPALSFTKRTGTPMLTDWNDWFGRGGLMEVLRPRWYKLLFGAMETYFEESYRTSADGLTVIASALADRAIKLGVSPEKILLIHGGTAPLQYPARNIMECREYMGYPKDIPILGFCSSDSHLDVDIVFQMIAVIRQKYPDIKMIVTGSVREQILKMARMTGVIDNLILPGYLKIEELSWCLGCADVFILPFPPTIYNLGRWPNKIGLYMCQARPTVSNYVGDIRPLFDNNPIGLTAAYNPEDMAAKTAQLIDNPEQATIMGQNALQRAKTEMNWENLIVNMEDFYYRIISAEKEKECHSIV